MILRFKNTNDDVITSIATKEDTIDLNMEIDFEAASAGSGTILHNNSVIGSFVRTAGSPVTISFLNGNYTRKVQDGDIFKLMVTSPIVTNATLTVERVNITDVPKVAKVLREVTRFLSPTTFTRKLTNASQRNILTEFHRSVTPKHLSTFIKELLYQTRDIPIPNQSTFVKPDAFYCNAGITLIISVSDILTNDNVLIDGSVVANSTVDALEIIAVKSPVGGTITTTLFNGKISAIRFNNTLPIGSTGSFICEIKNKLTNEIFNSQVTIYIKAPHPINAITDVYNLTQWGTLNLTKSQLLSNDSSIYLPVTFVEIISGSTIRGTVSVVGDTISFTGTGLVGQSASFQYRIKDAQNNTAIGTVNINILELPLVEAYIFSSADATVFRASYIPPTLTQIFNTWARFSNNGLYFPPGSTPTDEAASWELFGTGFRCTVNSSYLTGFVSPKDYSTYTHEATIGSIGADDDTIALVVAFKRVGTVNNSLLAVRTSGTTNVPGYTGVTSWSLATNINGVIKIIATLPSYSIIRKDGGWSTLGKTRVKVDRIGSMITIYCSQFGTTNVLAASKIEIDLNDYPELAWALDPCAYGYACHSQQYSTYENVIFEGGINTTEIFDFQLNCVWEYLGGVWTKHPTKTIQSVLGYPRTVTNTENSKTYRIEQNSITLIP
jgi:hypothetical protein